MTQRIQPIDMDWCKDAIESGEMVYGPRTGLPIPLPQHEAALSPDERLHHLAFLVAVVTVSAALALIVAAVLNGWIS